MIVRLVRRYDLIATVLLFLLAIPAQHFEWLALSEQQTITLRHQLRLKYGGMEPLEINKNIVLVNTDERFFKSYKSFPLRRTDIGRLVTNLKALGAKVVAVDMLMDFPSSYGEDPILAADLRQAGDTLLVSQGDVRGGRMTAINYPTATLAAASQSAYTNISSSNRWVTSMSRLKVYRGATALHDGWPFAVQAAATYLGVEPRLDGNTLRLGNLAIPLDPDGHLYIDFPRLPAGDRYLSQSAGIGAWDFLDLSQADDEDRAELSYWVKGKIALIGDTSEVSHDWFDTPVGSVYGAEIIADTINTILEGGPLRAISPAGADAVVLAMMAALLTIVLLVTTPWRRGAGVLLLLGGFIAAAFALYVRRGLIVPVSYAVVATLLSYLVVEFRQYLIERDQKKMIAKTFGQYIPEELVAEMSRSGKSVSVGGESREMTVLFSDVRGFTTISEGLAPNDLTRLMNAFLSPMTRVIHQNRGTIDKYMGDAIMAFWGAPLEDPGHARHAVAAALAMVRTMAELAQDFTARGWKPIKVGIGLNTGVMNVGNMGSDFRLAYTVLGDAVNLGSRIESLTKQYGVDVMVSEFTQAAVPGLVSREIDLVRVKGKDQPVRLFEPLGFEGEVASEVTGRLDRHRQALDAYRGRRWDEAEAAFAALDAEQPGHKINALYLDRIRECRLNPPPPEWDGVYTHKEK